MPDDSDPRRDALTAFLTEQGPIGDDQPAVLTGWACVMEWMNSDGDRWLSRGWMHSLAQWQANGMFHEALYGTWGDDD